MDYPASSSKSQRPPLLSLSRWRPLLLASVCGAVGFCGARWLTPAHAEIPDGHDEQVLVLELASITATDGSATPGEEFWPERAQLKPNGQDAAIFYGTDPRFSDGNLVLHMELQR